MEQQLKENLMWIWLLSHQVSKTVENVHENNFNTCNMYVQYMLQSLLQLLWSYKTGLHPKRREVSEDEYSGILAKLKLCLQEHLTGAYVPQNIEKQFHGWRFTANYLQVDLQISPQWEDPNLEDLYSYMRDMHPDRRILYEAKHANRVKIILWLLHM